MTPEQAAAERVQNAWEQFDERGIPDEGLPKRFVEDLETLASAWIKANDSVTEKSQGFCIVRDNNSHWYIIAADRVDAFDDWVRCQELCLPMETDLKPIPVNGPQSVRFMNWSAT